MQKFLSSDPFIQDPRVSNSFNRYAYVWNNPTNNVDPSGYSMVAALENDFDNPANNALFAFKVGNETLGYDVARELRLSVENSYLQEGLLLVKDFLSGSDFIWNDKLESFDHGDLYRSFVYNQLQSDSSRVFKLTTGIRGAATIGYSIEVGFAIDSDGNVGFVYSKGFGVGVEVGIPGTAQSLKSVDDIIQLLRGNGASLTEGNIYSLKGDSLEAKTSFLIGTSTDLNALQSSSGLEVGSIGAGVYQLNTNIVPLFNFKRIFE